MKTIIISNQKGGVGKTTTCQALICGLKDLGYRVLALDLDTQCNLTSWFNLEDYHYDVTDIFLKKIPIKKVITNDLIPSCPNVSLLEQHFSLKYESILKLKEELQSLKDLYDFVIIDCPPAINRITLSGFIASDYVIIPSTADKYAIEGITQVSEAIESVKKESNKNLVNLGILLIRYNPRSTLQKNTLEALKNNNYDVFDTQVRESIAIREAQTENKSILTYSSRAKASIDYLSFVNEVLNKISKGDKK